jgi:hypothetical protein
MGIQRDQRARTAEEQEPQLRPGHLSHTTRHLIAILHGPGGYGSPEREKHREKAIPVDARVEIAESGECNDKMRCIAAARCVRRFGPILLRRGSDVHHRRRA